MYLKSVVRVNTAPAALLQLHLGVEIFLVLLHDVGQVRTTAALCVVLLTVAVVMVVMVMMLWNSSYLWSFNDGERMLDAALSVLPLEGAAAFKALMFPSAVTHEILAFRSSRSAAHDPKMYIIHSMAARCNFSCGSILLLLFLTQYLPPSQS